MSVASFTNIYSIQIHHRMPGMVIEQTETVYWIIYTTIRLATLLFYQETATLTGYLTSLVSTE